MNEASKLLSYRTLGDTIEKVFTEPDKYRFDKHVPTFELDGKFLGDFFDFVMLEFRGDKPPLFYHTYSPFDVVSGKTSQYGAVFDAAELVFSGEISPYVRQRTAVMSPLVFTAIGLHDFDGKQVLFVGTGKIAQCALTAFKEYYPDMIKADFVNNGSDASEFLELARSLGIEVKRGDLGQIGNYGVIVCHSAAKQPVLTADMLPHIQPGAFIAAFASEDKAEVAAEYFDSAKANILIDWEQTATEAAELRSALEEGLTKKDALLQLKDVFSGKSAIDEQKQFTIYRSHGTPMQNLAFLQLLMHA